MIKLEKNDYDVVVIGSGPGGAVAANRLAKKGRSVLLLEAGHSFNTTSNIGDGLFSSYWNAGVIPMFGPFIAPFGEAKVLGGGSIINGGLLWPTPKNTLEKWMKILPESVFASQTWRSTESKLMEEFSVSSNEPYFAKGNKASKFLVEGAKSLGWNVVNVPRAASRCTNSNRCGSGCKKNAKNTVVDVLLSGIKNITVITDCLVTRLEQKDNSTWKIFVNIEGENKCFETECVIISAGATESPNILRKSKISSQAGNWFEFHLNFKILARFPNESNFSEGTILTHQIQEFEDEGILLMSSNINKPYLATSLSHLENASLKKYIQKSCEMAIYTVMIRPEIIKGKVRKLLGQTFCKWNWTNASFEKTKFGLLKLAEVLFKAGAAEIILPLRTSGDDIICQNISQVENSLVTTKQKSLIGVSVHGMSGCKMGTTPQNSVVDTSCRVWGYDNLFVLDSSVLPTNVGESPQLTIMTMVDEVISRW
jgi:choline dehydrogenase-like flavoprotein